MIIVLLLLFKVWGLRTDSHLRTRIFEIDRLPNFLKYGAPLGRFRRTGAALKVMNSV